MTEVEVGWEKANAGVSPLRRKSAPSVEMTKLGGEMTAFGVGWVCSIFQLDFAGAKESQFGGFSTALRFGRNDRGCDGWKRTKHRGLSAAAQKRAFGRDDRVLGWGEREPIRGFLHCAALRSK